MKKILLLFLIILLPGFAMGESQEQRSEQSTTPALTATKHEINGNALLSLLDLETSIRERIGSREKLLETEHSNNEQKRIKEEIEVLEKHYSEATADFERLATGVDPATFSEKRKDTFSWKEELTSLLKPAIRELKSFTINAREKTTLQADIAHHEELLPIADNALKHLQDKITEAENPELKQTLQNLLPEWHSINEQLHSSLDVLYLKLQNIEQRDKPFLDDIQDSAGHFFKNRGFYLAMAFTVFVLTLLCFSFLRKFVQSRIPALHRKKRSFFVRLLDILFRLVGFFVASLTLFIVFYLVEDWTLLSLLVVLFVAIAWTFRVMIPKFWVQGEILLNVGSVREGERLMLHGVPWLVKKINMFTVLENPDLNVQLRLPIEKLVGLYSRQSAPDESWFPCRRNDWVILSDESFGKAISISHEFVTLLERGGSRKTYQTADFLALAPRNLSTNFRVKEVFGVSYDLQQQVTAQLVDVMLAFVRDQFELDGSAEHLLDLQVSFQQAGASSLDIAIVADFKGNAAPLYNKIRRNIQRYCVEACTANDWEIPFPQLTLHSREIT